ncbi:MAG: class I SAM-dependent methyltransferase [Bacteroidia bacterium]
MKELLLHKVNIHEIERDLNVSLATIRNWIKLGYLKKLNGEWIDKESYDKFLAEYVGKQKLHSRANKQHKVQDNTIHLFQKYSALLESNTDAEVIAQQYENDLSESHKNKEGIFYTPVFIIDEMLNFLDKDDLSCKTFLDPSCGTGNFLIQAIKKGILPENIYGFDTDEISVKITIKRIYQLTGYKTENIICADFLNEIGSSQNNLFKHSYNQKFDYIFTNPPWGKKLQYSTKTRYGQIFNAGDSLDTSALFLFASLKILSKNGKLGFLLPESVFNIGSFEDIRKELLSYHILSILNFGKGFKELLTTTQAIIIENKSNTNKNILISHHEKKHNNFYYRHQLSFKSNPKTIFNFWINNEENKVIEKIFSHQHITLKNNAIWGMGIVTGNNKEFCKTEPVNQNYIPVWKGEDILPNELKPPTLYIDKNLSIYQQSAPQHLYEAKEKIIYRFITPRLCFYLDKQQRYILNSANFFILSETFPIPAEELVKYLNSHFINWLFQALFKTHKILRSDLEELPIITDYFQTFTHFDEQKFLDFINLTPQADGSYRIKK